MDAKISELAIQTPYTYDQLEHIYKLIGSYEETEKIALDGSRKGIPIYQAFNLWTCTVEGLKDAIILDKNLEINKMTWNLAVNTFKVNKEDDKLSKLMHRVLLTNMKDKTREKLWKKIEKLKSKLEAKLLRKSLRSINDK